MKQTQASLLREINRAHKKAHKLLVKAGYKGLKYSKLSKDDIYEIEIKLTPEEFKAVQGKDIHIEDYDLKDRDIAYFYDRKDADIFTCEKIRNGKLKEYYASVFDLVLKLHDDEASFAQRFNGFGKQLVNVIDCTLRRSSLATGFFVNDVFFYPSYMSFDIDKNAPDEMYFYPDMNEHTESFYLSKDFSKKTIEIIRVNISSLKVSQIYVETFLGDGNVEFVYYNRDNFDKPKSMLKTIANS